MRAIPGTLYLSELGCVPLNRNSLGLERCLHELEHLLCRMEDSSSDPSSHVKNATRVSVILALEGRETGIIGLLGYQLSSRFSKSPCLKKIWLSVINQGTGVSTLASAYRHAGIFTYVHTHIRAQIHTPLPLPSFPSTLQLYKPHYSKCPRREIILDLMLFLTK